MTDRIVAFSNSLRFADLPGEVRAHTVRALLNHMGCVLGGCHEPAVEAAVQVARLTGGVAQASLFGHGLKTDIVNASFVNCLGSAALAYDDTHLATVTHPTGPVASALIAFAEQFPVSGEDFLVALALGIEVQCRLSNVLLLPPAKANLSLYITGVTGPVGAALGVARLMRLDAGATASAMGLAAAQAAGFRATHGSMAGAFPPAHAARAGILGALLASNGFNCSSQMIEGKRGLIDIFAEGADAAGAIAGLGVHYELLANAYKPYPAGIVVHPAIDACLEVVEHLPPAMRPVSICLTVHPLALSLTDRQQPSSIWEAQISLQHWAAVSILHRRAGIRELNDACIHDPAVIALRSLVTIEPRASFGRDEARARIEIAGGQAYEAHVRNARGSAARPMSDAELDAKFNDQASHVLSKEKTRDLLESCRNLTSLGDVGKAIAAAF